MHLRAPLARVVDAHPVDALVEAAQRWPANGIPDNPKGWLVTAASRRLIERWRPGDERPEIVRDVLIWQPVQTVEPLTLDLPALFSQVLGG